MSVLRKKTAFSDADLACPVCHGLLNASLRCKSCGHKFKRREGFAWLLPSDLPEDMRLSIERWDLQWAKLKGSELAAQRRDYHRHYLKDTLNQLLPGITPKSHPRFLEIGCGPSFLGEALAKKGFQVAGVDCCVQALRASTRVHKGLKSYFVAGDLHHIPLKDDSVDFLYGGGVIEHFRDTVGCVRELHRVLRPGGVSFNTVPYMSIAGLGYRQTWGNCPAVPGLRQLFELVHLKLLGGRHMKYGYELSFPASTMRRLHEQAGFKDIKIYRFEVYMPLTQIPGPLKALATKLTRWRPFWPTIAIVATK
jgi:ubiquinone/menaquinone biosynthesis C-methylase UbiE